MKEHLLPYNTKSALIFEDAVMFVFSSITVDFRYKGIESNADSFFIDYCLPCGLRNQQCKSTGALGHCLKGYSIERKTLNKTVKLQIPEDHCLVLSFDESPRFFYTDEDSLKSLVLGNIGYSGWWCNGDVDVDPKNPLDIYTKFMTTEHNRDLTELGLLDYDKYITDLSKGVGKIIGHFEIKNLEDSFGLLQFAVEKPTHFYYAKDPFDGSYLVNHQLYIKVV